MGGLAGHMSHLYENPRLTFAQIKEILKNAAEGELEGTEKTDGQNLYISFSVSNQKFEFIEKEEERQAAIRSMMSPYSGSSYTETLSSLDFGDGKAVRNKGNVKAGGMTIKQLADKFSFNKTLKKSFSQALRDFEKVIKRFPRSKQEEIFGPDTNIYYNVEIINPETANVINYDSKFITIHGGGAEFDKETGDPVEVEIIDPETGELITGQKDVSKYAGILSSELGKIQQNIADNKFKVQMDAVFKLKAIEDKEALHSALSGIDSEISSEGVSDGQMIIEYVMARVLSMIRERGMDIDKETEELLLKRILLSNKSYRNAYGYDYMPKELDPRKIVKNASQKDKNSAIYIIKNADKILKEAIEPIEMIIHDFSVEMLKGLESLFILDNKKETERLRKEVSKAIRAIEKSGNKGALEILQKQMSKLRNVENISTAAEGFVFDHDGWSYKFTGNFAPVNQILGLFRFGRKGICPLKNLTEAREEEAKRKVVLYPGRFQPMGRHHLEVFKKLQREHGEEAVFIVTSNKTHPERSPLTFDEKKKIILKHGIPESQIIQARNPYDASELAGVFNPDDVIVVYAVGKKDMKESPRFSKLDAAKKDGTPYYLKSYERSIDDLQTFDNHAYVMVAPHVSMKLQEDREEMSGTTIRKIMNNLDPEGFKLVMGWFDKDIYEMLKGKISKSTTSISEGISLKKNDSNEFNMFMKEYQKLSSQNPLNPRERYWYMGKSDSGKDCVVMTELRPWGTRIHLSSINTVPAGECEAKGYASAVMSTIVKLADQADITLSLDPSPFGSERLGAQDLKAWYRKVGFKQSESGDWIREPGFTLKWSKDMKFMGESLSGTVFSIIEEVYSEKQNSKDLKKENEDLEEIRIISDMGYGDPNWRPTSPGIPGREGGKRVSIKMSPAQKHTKKEEEKEEKEEEGEVFDPLEELSGAGAAGGYSLPLGMKPEYFRDVRPQVKGIRFYNRKKKD